MSISREKGRTIYRVRFKDHLNVPRYMQGFKSKEATRVLEKKLQELSEHLCAGMEPPAHILEWINLKLDGKRKGQLMRWNMIQKDRIGVGEPLGNKLDQWRDHLLAEGCRKDHVEQQRSRAGTTLEQFQSFSEIDAERTRAHVNHLKLVKEWSDQTARHYMAAAKAFTRWMMRFGEAPRDPLAILSTPKVPRNRYKRVREALSRAEAEKLVAGASQSTSVYMGLSGPQRALLYELAIETGYRATAIWLLEPRHLRHGDEGWWIEAPRGTRKRTASVPIPDSLAEKLRQVDGVRLIQGPGPKEYSRFLKKDCREAGVREIDFHTFRHTRVTWLSESGVSLEDAKELLGHKQISTTVDVYKTVRMSNLFAAARSVQPVTTRGITDRDSRVAMG